MASSPEAAKRTVAHIARWAIWPVCGAIAVAVTLAWLGHGSLRTESAVTPVSTSTTAAAPHHERVDAAQAAAHTSSAVVAHTAIDALARLEKARANPLPPSAANASNTFDEALQHALSYPAFDALDGRTDAEGLIEAAAWADACARSTLPAQDQTLRCTDARLRDPHYADTLLRKAAEAGQPAAALTLASRNPTQWMEVPLANDDTLGEHIFTLAAHGNATALAMLTQWCATPDACTDSQLTRNTLALLQLGLYKTGTSDASQYLTGNADEQRAAVDRADALRKLLKWPS
ncbi:hypothetical protein [Paraburkholderia flava]|uniref:hypothetical protein n=1 Tax=Paraburkholderia flava TaxID=2547393 RepID=UPI00105EA861|nr:hypothetical protein [Paraburkholderia flava]